MQSSPGVQPADNCNDKPAFAEHDGLENDKSYRDVAEKGKAFSVFAARPAADPILPSRIIVNQFLSLTDWRFELGPEAVHWGEYRALGVEGMGNPAR